MQCRHAIKFCPSGVYLGRARFLEPLREVYIHLPSSVSSTPVEALADTPPADYLTQSWEDRPQKILRPAVRPLPVQILQSPVKEELER